MDVGHKPASHTRNGGHKGRLGTKNRGQKSRYYNARVSVRIEGIYPNRDKNTPTNVVQAGFA